MSADLDGGGYRASNLNSIADTAPNAPCEFQYPGTLWLRNDGAGHGSLWVKTGSGDCDWQQVALVP